MAWSRVLKSPTHVGLLLSRLTGGSLDPSRVVGGTGREWAQAIWRPLWWGRSKESASCSRSPASGTRCCSGPRRRSWAQDLNVSAPESPYLAFIVGCTWPPPWRAGVLLARLVPDPGRAVQLTATAVGCTPPTSGWPGCWCSAPSPSGSPGCCWSTSSGPPWADRSPPRRSCCSTPLCSLSGSGCAARRGSDASAAATPVRRAGRAGDRSRADGPTSDETARRHVGTHRRGHRCGQSLALLPRYQPLGGVHGRRPGQRA